MPWAPSLSLEYLTWRQHLTIPYIASSLSHCLVQQRRLKNYRSVMIVPALLGNALSRRTARTTYSQSHTRPMHGALTPCQHISCFFHGRHFAVLSQGRSLAAMAQAYLGVNGVLQIRDSSPSIMEYPMFGCVIRMVRSVPWPLDPFKGIIIPL